MATLKVRKILNSLEKKGFAPSQGDHTFLILYVNGKKTSIHTKVSHGDSEINGYLINQMSIQLKLEKNRFLDLVNCPLSLESYLEILKGQGYSLT